MADMEKLKFGELIKEARLSQNMNQETLAQKVGCSVNTVSRWENNHYIPNLSDMQKISEILNVQFLINGDIVQIKKAF